VFNLVRLARFINCRQAARLISDAQERPLSLRDRIKLRLHLHWCVACTRYERQVGFLRRALNRYGK
jgi:Putative zinc-finger